MSVDKKNVKEIVVYICSLCRTISLSANAVASHMLESHQNDEEIKKLIEKSSTFALDPCKQSPKKDRGYTTQYKCTHCDYRTVHLTNYKRHISTHNRGKGARYLCPLCSHSSIQLNNLKRHIQTQHPDSTCYKDL